MSPSKSRTNSNISRTSGNYLDQNLPMAKWLAARYLERDFANIDESHLTYPTGE